MKLAELCPRLRRLDALLRRERMERGPDVWQSVYDLLLRLDGQGRLPEDDRRLCPLLGPLLCRSPEEQELFPRLFEEWLTGEMRRPAPAIVSTPAQRVMSRWRVDLSRFDRRWRLASIVLFLLLLGLIAFVLSRPPADIAAVKGSDPAEATPKPIGKVPDQGASVPITDQVNPNRLPQPDYLPPLWQAGQIVVGYLASGLPAAMAVWGLLYFYRRRLRLEKLPDEAKSPLSKLHFDVLMAPIFAGPGSRGALAALRPSVWEPTRRLDVSATVEATAHQAGYFVPRYRARRNTPLYLLLVRGLDRDDQRAALAEELAGRFAEAGIAVRTYRFRDDPRWLKPWGDTQGVDLSLAQLATEYGDARLLVLSEAEILFHPLNGQPRAWLKDLSTWRQRVWLHPGDAGLLHAELLWNNRFLALPLGGDSLRNLAAWLGSTAKAPPEPEGDDFLALPGPIRDQPEDWLSPQSPYGADLPQLYWELHWYLGTHGLLLLQALAVYPEPRWHLTLALDYLLFAAKEADQPERREQRLARLSRLPWLRHGHFPNYLREELLRLASKQDLAQIRGAWQRLFAQLTRRAAPGRLQLDMATPTRWSFFRQLLDLWGSRKVGALGDPVFANILLGGKLGLFDFRLPRAVARMLPGGPGLINWAPLVAALLFALGGGYGAMQAWDAWGKQALVSFWSESIRAENGRWPVQMHVAKGAETLVASLREALTDKGFKVNPDSGPITSQAADYRIGYPPEAEVVAQRLAQRLGHLTYGATFELRLQQEATAIDVELPSSYQPFSRFNDTLAYSFRPEEAKPSEDTNKYLPIEPQMVRIEPGKFLMGSPDQEPGRYANEGPQHPVSISRPFELGKTEVTFDEYDRFAQATGLELPDDDGWGRGKRPVVNVTWDDAKAYVSWLSQRTGKAYRLPTEAEWEYAARAGTTTPYWWGKDIGKNHANGGGGGSEWDGKQTAPVGSFQPNSFGLFDTAGNVWEWTEDCWHDRYKNAPQDGTAWLEAEGGDCARRVVRGGSWDFDPQVLRSANRGRSRTVEADLDLGFRVARAL